MAIQLSKVRPTAPIVNKGGNKITISSVFLETGLKPILPDSDGLYKIWGGGLNCENGRGDWYPFTQDIEKEFTDGKSSFSTRLAAGLVGGEANHPDISMYNGNKQAILQRLDRLDKTRECWAVHKVGLDFDSYVNPDGSKVAGIWIWVYPTGHYGPAAKAALESDKVNVTVSLRTLSINKLRPNMTWVRTVTKPLHWDWVEENGVNNASKLASQGYSMESLSNLTDESTPSQFSRDELEIDFGTVMDLKDNLASQGHSLESLGIDINSLEQMLRVTPNESHPAFNF